MTTRPPAPPSRTGWPTYERSILSNVLGLPGYAAIAIAFGFTGLGVFIDLNRTGGDLGAIFKGCYFAGCVLAVCWVKRRALFGPMVQPPLLMALAIPTIVLLSGDSGANGSPGLADHLLSIGAPLMLGFPTMAVTTAFVVGIGIIRYLLQRPSHAPAPPPRRPANRDRRAAAAPGDRRGATSGRRAAGAPADRRGAPGERRTTSGVPGEREGSGTPGERRGATERRTKSGVPGENRDQPKRAAKQRPTKQGGATSASGEQRAAERPSAREPGADRATGREPSAERKGGRSTERATGDRRASRESPPTARQRSGDRPPPEPRSGGRAADRTARRS